LPRSCNCLQQEPCHSASQLAAQTGMGVEKRLNGEGLPWIRVANLVVPCLLTHQNIESLKKALREP
jgi:hypothetical protein